MHVAHCDSEMAGANYSHFAKGSSNPDQNTAVIGRNLSFVRGEAVAKVAASLSFRLLDLYKKVQY
jgi:hypothetical protein